MKRNVSAGSVYHKFLPGLILNHPLTAHRARFCRQAIALSISIKNHFARVLNQQSDRSALTQILLPYPMPAHLEEDYEIVSSCPECNLPGSGPECNNRSERPSRTSLGICSQCVSLVDYADYLTSCLREGSSKGAKRRSRAASAEGKSNKRARLTEQLAPDGGRTRITAKHGRGCSSPVAGDAEDFTAGSALLLGMKRSRVDRSGLSSDSASNHEAQIDATAYASYAPALLPVGAYAGLFPYTRADTPEMFAPEDVLAGRGSGDVRGTSLSIAIGCSQQEPTTGIGVTVDDGRSLHEFLLACYRDGIYPSPAAGAAQQRQAMFVVDDGTTAPSYTDTGTETDSEGTPGVGACTVVLSRGDGAEGAVAACGRYGESVGLPRQPPSGEDGGGGAAVSDLAYEDLQMLLAHLLQDPQPTTAAQAAPRFSGDLPAE